MDEDKGVSERIQAAIRESDQRAIVNHRKMTDQQFLESMSQSDYLLEHDPDTICGMCHNQFLMAQVARDMLAAGFENVDVINHWSEESMRLWRESKFVKVWEQAKKEGKDPNKVFEELGWEP
jgi:hypothetical protein